MALIETLFYLGVSLQVITNNVYLIYNECPHVANQ